MSKRKHVTPTFKELKEDLKTMTFWQKVDHLWSYYKEILLIVLIVVLVLVITATSFINARKEYVFKGIAVNLNMTQEGYLYLTDGLLQRLGVEGKKHVQLDGANFTSLADPTSGEDNYAATMLLITRVSGGLLDCALIDQLALNFYWQQDVFGDLRTVFSQEELDALGDKVLPMKVVDDVALAMTDPTGEDTSAESKEETPEPLNVNLVPAAIDVTDLPFFQANITDGKRVFLIISANKPNPEAVRAFWEHINAWQPAA